MSAGFVSRTGVRVHALGPWVYVEHARFTLHAWARWFDLPWHRGFKWRVNLKVRHGHMVSRVNVGNG